MSDMTGENDGADTEHAADPWSHAREVEPTVDARVEFIESVMLAFLWERGKSAKSLAAIWGIPLSTVQNHSAEASRRVTGDADEARRDISAGARKLLREAINAKDANGFKAVATIWAEVSGAKAAEKHQIVSADATPAEAARLVREAFGEKALPKTNGLNGHAKPNGHGASPAVPAKPADD